ncbi:endonuclease dU [Methanoplanus endosymbiosus]|uniref:UPF0215 protein L6E24_02095 n=1 Tax=Methanoplanus endosymbiosus TaxID=33865 RepID=A0A9E7TM34_9EURY|nr:DUF99 family protein [Methanoplanus endosymbiosus]UUX92941.1 DUF99 family protein [Methanoplanus endosymbiosus]
MNTAKSGIRILGVAESTVRGAGRSIACGIVMRRDLIVDGICYGSITVGGYDATDSAAGLFFSLKRGDINCIMLSGTVVSWFNIINPDDLAEKTGLPVIAVTYEDSEGLAGDIERHFPGDSKRMAEYERLGRRTPIDLKTGYRVFIRTSGVDIRDAAMICNIMTLQGRIPEPLRLARICAKSCFDYISSGRPE